MLLYVYLFAQNENEFFVYFYRQIILMKLFVYLLSFYILVLCAMPCADVPKDNTLQKTELSKSTTGNQQSDFDYCSPFCTCNCCAVPIVFQVFIFEFNGFLYYQELLSEYKPSCSPSPCHSIWQPPKIG